ncbi:hypothetical protein [Sphingopyxis sp.]|uniref:hypothetical protein n=1 Tax=Sphingopyxis sp. TaxID=1908224 RepID=UPI0014854BAE|nr:hypothetical protein [Sphingopyxis sp.]MBR2174569.1 hypothetical protein [Sphingopyxis sp.]
MTPTNIAAASIAQERKNRIRPPLSIGHSHSPITEISLFEIFSILDIGILNGNLSMADATVQPRREGAGKFQKDRFFPQWSRRPIMGGAVLNDYSASTG